MQLIWNSALADTFLSRYVTESVLVGARVFAERLAERPHLNSKAIDGHHAQSPGYGGIVRRGVRVTSSQDYSSGVVDVIFDVVNTNSMP